MEAGRAAAIILILILACILIPNASRIVLSLPLSDLPLRAVEEAPHFLWIYRGADILVQAFIIMAAAAAVSSQFRREKKGREDDESS